MIDSMLCSFFGHNISRKRVWNDGYDYRTRCQRCEAPLIRGSSGWREFDTARDEGLPRKPHPNLDRV